MKNEKNKLEHLVETLNRQGLRAEEVLRLAVDALQPRFALASSFSVEDGVLIDLLHGITPEIRVFAIDTGRLPEETRRAAERMAAKYSLKVEWYFPEHSSVEQLVRAKGSYSFFESVESRLECCRIRKVEPLRRALAGLDGWITGQRKAQSATRSGLKVAEIDHVHGGIVKLNPLANWTGAEIWEYIRGKRVPFNALYSEGYASIGCAPCSRPISPGQDERAGRWWWESEEHKECGLHASNARERK